MFSRPLSRSRPAHAKNRLSTVFFAGTAGLEPVTYCVTGSRSNQLSYAPKFSFSTACPIFIPNTKRDNTRYGYPIFGKKFELSIPNLLAPYHSRTRGEI